MLKQELVEKLSNFHKSMPVYSIKKLSYNEMLELGKYYSSRFMRRDTAGLFRVSQRDDDSTLIHLSLDINMRIYHNSNTVTISRKMGPLEHLIKERFDKKKLSEIAINEMKKLELEKISRLSFEQLKFEILWQIKCGGVTIEEERTPVFLCRIVGAFRRYINEVPVYGRASSFIRLAGENMIESVGIDWRQINEKPIDNAKIIDPKIAAEKILDDLSSTTPKKVLTSEDYKPEFFALGYFSKPKRRQQNYMQPVYIAMFQDLGWTAWKRLIVIPATEHVYEPYPSYAKEFMQNDKFRG
jgi:hypothetical protein